MATTYDLGVIYDEGKTFVLITTDKAVAHELKVNGWEIQVSLKYRGADVCRTTSREQAERAAARHNLPIQKIEGEEGNADPGK